MAEERKVDGKVTPEALQVIYLNEIAGRIEDLTASVELMLVSEKLQTQFLEEPINLNYPKDEFKDLPIGTTVLDIKAGRVHFPDGSSSEEIYSPVEIEFCRSVGIYINNPVKVVFTLRGAIVHTAFVPDPGMKLKNLKYDKIRITTTVTTEFYVMMSTALDGAQDITFSDVRKEETPVFTDEEIRDTDAHNSDIADMSRYKIITIYVDNQLDQAVSVQIKANRSNSIAKSVNVGDAFNAATLDQQARTFEPTDEGYLPYVYVEVTCAVLPTAGDLNVYILGRN